MSKKTTRSDLFLFRILRRRLEKKFQFCLRIHTMKYRTEAIRSKLFTEKVLIKWFSKRYNVLLHFQFGFIRILITKPYSIKAILC